MTGPPEPLVATAQGAVGAGARGGMPPGGGPIVQPSTRELVADYVRRRIFTGEFPAHSRVPQDEVAAALGISRIPVREALVALEAEGFVVSPTHQGAFVNPLIEYDIRCHFELRGFTHGLASRRAAEIGTTGFVGDVTDIVGFLQRTDNPDEFLAGTAQFYSRIHDIGGTPGLTAALRRLHNYVPGNFYAEVPGAIAMARNAFDIELAALTRHDPGAAQSAAIETGLGHADVLITMLDRQGRLAG